MNSMSPLQDSEFLSIVKDKSQPLSCANTLMRSAPVRGVGPSPTPLNGTGATPVWPVRTSTLASTSLSPKRCNALSPETLMNFSGGTAEQTVGSFQGYMHGSEKKIVSVQWVTVSIHIQGRNSKL